MKMKMLKKIINIFNSIILCLRFPFLYPRNRFTGLHYNNWEINKFLTNSKGLAYTNVIVNIVNESKLPEIKSSFCTTNTITVLPKKTSITLSNKRKIANIDISKYCDGEIKYIKKDFNKENRLTIYVVVKDDIEINSHFIAETFITDEIMYFILKVMEWFYNYPLQWIHCIPTYTELDALDKGWRKAFGIRICKDIKRSLLKVGGKKALKKYRILQIKEKYGYLHWYDSGGNDEIMREIIPKYEDESLHTCIHCGKLATKMSKGWISPYCDKCIGNREYTENE